jgi:hypothetical protein
MNKQVTYGHYRINGQKGILGIINAMADKEKKKDPRSELFKVLYELDGKAFSEFAKRFEGRTFKFGKSSTTARSFFTYCLKNKWIELLPVIRNCHLSYQCHKTWDELEPVKGYARSVKFCSECKREVYLCESEDELAGYIAGNKCVAIDKSLLDKYSYTYKSPLLVSEEGPYLMGTPGTPPIDRNA